MRYQTSRRFDSDYRALPPEHRRMFKTVVPAFSAACDAYVEEHRPWPRALRVSRMVGTRDIWEMTWSFASPDGRATFALISSGKETMVLWRRIGSHRVYQQP